MALRVSFVERTLTSELEFPQVSFAVERFSWSVYGGPLKATIRAGGIAWALYDLVNALRAGVLVEDEHGVACWWGMLGDVTVDAGGIQFGASLKTMANAVAVAYEDVAAGMTVGQRATTEWLLDNDSVIEFGQKEMLDRLNSGSEALALARQAKQLAAHRYPVPVIRQQQGGKVGATLECGGWFDTLDWRYYLQEGGQELYDILGIGVQAFGNASGSEKLAQSWATPVGTATWYASTVSARIRKEGSPTDTVTLELYSDSAGAPGTLLATASVDGASLTSEYAWVLMELDTQVTIAANTTFWLVMRRSGGLDASHHYLIDVNESMGYTRGVLRLWNGGAWVARSTDADALFKVSGLVETTQQLADLITSLGLFLNGTTIEDASGIKTSPYRDGDSLGLTVARGLLDSGTQALKRLLATVLVDRSVTIAEEPDQPAEKDVEVYLQADGLLVDGLGNLVGAAETPVGKWAMLRDVLPPSLNVSRLIDPTMFFIEEAEYDAASGQWTATRTRGAGSVFDDSQEG